MGIQMEKENLKQLYFPTEECWSWSGIRGSFVLYVCVSCLDSRQEHQQRRVHVRATYMCTLSWTFTYSLPSVEAEAQFLWGLFFQVCLWFGFSEVTLSQIPSSEKRESLFGNETGDSEMTLCGLNMDAAFSVTYNFPFLEEIFTLCTWGDFYFISKYIWKRRLLGKEKYISGTHKTVQTLRRFGNWNFIGIRIRDGGGDTKTILELMWDVTNVKLTFKNFRLYVLCMLRFWA